MLLQDKVAVIYGAGGPSAAPSPAPSPPRQVALPIAAYTRSYLGPPAWPPGGCFRTGRG
jgi:hypothetical protein